MSVPAELGCLGFVIFSLALVPSARRVWRGQPTRIDRGFRNAYGPLWVNWERSFPTSLVGSILFFGGGGLAAGIGGFLPAHHQHRGLTLGIVVVIAAFLIFALIACVGVVFVLFTFTTKWYGWPKRLIPPHLREAHDDLA